MIETTYGKTIPKYLPRDCYRTAARLRSAMSVDITITQNISGEHETIDGHRREEIRKVTVAESSASASA